MNQNWKSACVAAALLAITGAASAAGHDKTHGKAHDSTPPASSNRQSLPDADRGLDRAAERRPTDTLEQSPPTKRNANDETARQIKKQDRDAKRQEKQAHRDQKRAEREQRRMERKERRQEMRDQDGQGGSKLPKPAPSSNNAAQ